MQITKKLLKHILYLKNSHVNRCDVVYLLRRKMSSNTNNDRTVAVASMLSTSDKQHNLAQVETIIEKAKEGNAKVFDSLSSQFLHYLISVFFAVCFLPGML